MGCKPSPYATKVGSPRWKSSEKLGGSPIARLRGIAKEYSRKGTKEETRGPGNPEDGAARLLNELEELDVRHGDCHCFIHPTFTELL